MSDGDVIVISSDEDPDSATVFEEKKYIIDTDAALTSVEQLRNNWANEISSLDLPNHSDHIYSMATETETSCESSDTVGNAFYIHESEAFKKFISVVLPAEPDENDRARIVKKLNKYCQLADPNYIRSPEFDEVLEKGVERILRDPIYLYFVLKDVKDSLLAHKMEFRSLPSTEDELLSSGENATENPSEDNSLDNLDNLDNDDLEDEEKEERKSKIVNKLTLLLKNVDEKIKELEELEVDFSDEEDSNYFKMQRYRERFCQVYEKLCNYTNKPLNANRVGGVKKINFSDTDNLELNRAIEKWLNKTGQFPDYSDVNKLMIELNQSLNLKLTKEQVKIKAQQVFENIGNKLQRRRNFDLWDSLSSFLNTDADPAVKDPELQCVLKQNYEMGMKKEKELLKHYAEMQEQEQLQPREVPDEEANCSPAESDDEDEEEIDMLENMLNSKISTDDDEYGDGSDESGNDESDNYSFRFPDSITRNEGPSKMFVNPNTRVEYNDPQRASVSNENFEHMDGVGSKGIDSFICVNSEKTETVVTNTRTIPVRDENMVGAIANEQDTEDNLVVCKSENFMKRKNENLNENDNDNLNIHPCKKFLEEREMTEARNFEETEVVNKSDCDSDCEIIEIVTNKGGETSKDLSLNRKMYQVNYAFINNNFNYNTVLSNNAQRKKHCFTSNYKNVKNQKPSQDFPPNELTNIKSIANKNAVNRENKAKKKSKNIINKAKSVNSITWQTSKDSDLKNNDFAISAGTSSVNCSLDQGKSGENMKSQKEVNKTNQNNDLEQGSNNETAAPPNGGSSSGGNGEDNSENNGNKKPTDRDPQIEDNPENEDKEEEDEEEDADTPENKPPETPKAIEAAPKLIFSRTNQKEQKVSGAAVFKLPSTEKVAPARRNSLGKQWEKPPGSENTQRKEPLNSTPAARSPRARQAPVRKRKINQNGGTQGTPQQGKSNVFTFQFQKGPAELKKPNVNRAIPTASSSRNHDAELNQATKKKRSTAAKPVQSDEEIVKNFLERSHPSISITTPKKKAVQKEPPPSVRQALETLSRLKGISATIVKGSSKQDSDDEVTIIGETLNTRVKKISKQQKTPPSATAVMPPPVATATTSLEPLLPKIVTVQGNIPGFEDIVDDSTVIRDNSHQNYVQIPQASLVNVSGIKTNYSEQFYTPQPNLTNVSGTVSNYNEHFYSPQARLANVSSTISNYNEHLYGPQATVATVPGSASTFQENLYGPQTTAASIPGSASTYEDNFTGTVECIPIPRFRNFRSRSRRTPKKTKNIEYVILD